jgi:hypothetical protein
MEVPRAFGLSSQRPGPGELIYRFCMAALGGAPGDLFCSRSREFRLSLIHEVFGPSLSYATPLKHPGRGVSHSGHFVRGCCVVLYEDSCTSVGVSWGDR